MEGLEEEDDGQGVDLNDEDDKMRIQFSSLGRVAVGIDGQVTSFFFLFFEGGVLGFSDSRIDRQPKFHKIQT